jgi:hypothetical protein
MKYFILVPVIIFVSEVVVIFKEYSELRYNRGCRMGVYLTHHAALPKMQNVEDIYNIIPEDLIEQCIKNGDLE